MKTCILFVIGLFCFISVNAQELYDVSKIPAELLKNASVVIRNEEQIYEVKNPGSAVMEYRTAVTILNKSGEAASNMHEFYNKFSSISGLKASIYGATGKKIKDYKTSDFRDRSVVSDGTMYQDDRVKYLEFSHTSYPYTIEYSYRVDFTGIRTYPDWYPASTWNQAVETSSFVFKIPQGMTFKYLKSEGLATDSSKVKDKLQYKWSCRNVKALEYEPMSTGMRNVMPWVTLAPNQFEYDNSKANIENWANLGSWMYNLSSGMQELPEAAKVKILNLIKDAGTPEEKISILYKHLQANTRYVGVQLGIGGYKPIAAEKVFSVNYGDCKALSNYMKAMLEVAGIKSNLVVIGNGMPSLNRNFASVNQANHMILCVPLEKDTTWLECTSQYVPLGYIGNDNSDRTVLLVTENGGKLARTPVYNPADNYQKRSARVDLNEDGNADIQIETQYGYAQFEENLRMLIVDPTEQRKSLMNSLSIPNMQIGTLSYLQPDKNAAMLTEKISLKASQLLTKGGDKLFLTVNLLNRQESAVTTLEDRKTSFSVNYSFKDEDEIIYTIPKGYKIEFIPKDISIASEFGMYSAKFTVKDDKLIYTRTKMMVSKKYPPEKYNDFAAFYKKIYQADKQKSILAKME
jgi:transglutaminase-like putative cysteine protease